MYTDEAVLALEARGFKVSREAQTLYDNPHPLWFKQGRFDINSYRQMRDIAHANGIEDILPPADYVRGLSNALLTPEQRMEAELVMSEVTLRMAREMQGRTDLPGASEIASKRDLNALRTQDLGGEMTDALRTNKIGGWLDSLAPQSEEYRGISCLYRSLKDPEESQFAKATLAYMRREPDLPADDILKINLATQELDARIGGQAFTSDVIIGKAETPSSLFLRNVDYVTAQKDWNVPRSLQDSVGKTVIRTSPGNPTGEGVFGARSPDGTFVHGYGADKEHLFSEEVRTFSNGCIRVKNFHQLMAASLVPEAAEMAGYTSNDELMEKVGAVNGTRWANTDLNNTRLTTRADLKIASVFRPVFLRDGQAFINTSDPYGWAANYRSPEAFDAAPADHAGNRAETGKEPVTTARAPTLETFV
jgi:murein L,D-transpeptidase YcbB/YkuD